MQAVSSRSCVLVVDDEELYRQVLERLLRQAGHTALGAGDAQSALALLSARRVDCLITDMRMPGIDGLELVRQARELQPGLPCIVLSGETSPEQSLEALRAGAFWYLEKPFEPAPLEVVRSLVKQALASADRRGAQRDTAQRTAEPGVEGIVGTSPGMQRVLEIVGRVAASECTVLIRGESGTGKELIACAIHRQSRRNRGRLVAVNCGAIPEELLESELFGHVKGAFTSAVGPREGRFAAAEGGTLFLDEIGDMSPKLQVKVLRALQDGSYEPVGSSETRRADVRVIAATHRDLEAEIAAGRFREDLYYRLNVIPLDLPPLRERRGDIPLLFRHFLESGRSDGQPIPLLSDEALELLLAHDWPGNVRELENLVRRLTILCDDGVIEASDLPAAIRQRERTTLALPRLPTSGLSFREVVDDFETDLIVQALERTHGNKNQAARLLGLNRTTLLEKMKKKGLEPLPRRSH